MPTLDVIVKTPKHVSFIFFLTLICPYSLAQAQQEAEKDPCGRAIGISASACQLRIDLKAADHDVNQAYAKILEELRQKKWTATLIRKLTASQRSWLAYRRDQCKFEQESGTAALNLPWLACRVDITQTRILYLKELIKNYDY